jgi:DNA-binding beta-propeller fold protein YncE
MQVGADLATQRSFIPSIPKSLQAQLDKAKTEYMKQYSKDNSGTAAPHHRRQVHTSIAAISSTVNKDGTTKRQNDGVGILAPPQNRKTGPSEKSRSKVPLSKSAGTSVKKSAVELSAVESGPKMHLGEAHDGTAGPVDTAHGMSSETAPSAQDDMPLDGVGGAHTPQAELNGVMQPEVVTNAEVVVEASRSRQVERKAEVGADDGQEDADSVDEEELLIKLVVMASLDRGGHRQRESSYEYSTVGKILRATGQVGRADGQFSCAAGVAVTPDGIIYVEKWYKKGDSSGPELYTEELFVSARPPPLDVASDIRVPSSPPLRPRFQALRSPPPRLLAPPGMFAGEHHGHAHDQHAAEGEGAGTNSVGPGAAKVIGESGDIDLPSSPSAARGTHAALSPRRVNTHGPATELFLEHRGAEELAPGATHVGAQWSSSTLGSLGSTAQHGGVQVLKPIASGLTFVADVENHAVQVLRGDGSHARRLGSLGQDPGCFNSLHGIACNHGAGLLFVSDTCNHRVQVFSFRRADASDLKLIKVIGKHGRAPGQMAYPGGLALDADKQTLIVADTGNDRVQIFTQDGELLHAVGSAGRNSTNRFGAPLFHNPCDVAVSHGLIWVLDKDNHRVQVLTDEGEHVRDLGSYGTKPGHFVNPRQILACPGGIILVADQEETRVQLLIPDRDDGKPYFRWARIR